MGAMSESLTTYRWPILSRRLRKGDFEIHSRWPLLQAAPLPSVPESPEHVRQNPVHLQATLCVDVLPDRGQILGCLRRQEVTGLHRDLALRVFSRASNWSSGIPSPRSS